MSQRRLFKNLIWGLFGEVVNKITPLLTVAFAQRKLGALFGVSQFAMHFVDLANPFILFGYPLSSPIAIAQRRENNLDFAPIISGVMVLKAIHCVVSMAVILGICFMVPHYRPYLTPIFFLQFALLGTAIDTTFYFTATQSLSTVSKLNVVAKMTSLILVYLLVAAPQDYIVYAVIVFGGNFMISLGTVFLTFQKISFVWPSKKILKDLFLQSLPLGIMTMLMALLERYDFFVAESFLGYEEVGWYAGPLRLMKSIFPFIYIMGNVFYSEALLFQNEEQYKKNVKLSLWAVGAFAVPVGIGSFFLGADILGIVYEKTMSTTWATFGVLCASLVPQGLLMVVGQQVLCIRGQVRPLNVYLALAAVISMVSSWLLAKPFGAVGIAGGVNVGFWVAFFLAYFRARQIVDLGLLRIIGGLILPAIGLLLVLVLLQEQSFVLSFIVASSVYMTLLLFVQRKLVKSALERFSKPY